MVTDIWPALSPAELTSLESGDADVGALLGRILPAVDWTRVYGVVHSCALLASPDGVLYNMLINGLNPQNQWDFLVLSSERALGWS